MPYKSDAQRRFVNATHPKGMDVAKWNKESKGKKLPERVKKKPKK